MRGGPALLGALALILVSAAAGAQGPDQPASGAGKRSLMFTREELAQIMGALNNQGPDKGAAADGKASEPARPRVPNVYVSAVADFGSGRWIVWANGVRIVPGRQAPGFKVMAVRDDRVELLVESDPPARVTLHAHQTWLSQSNAVVEGIIP